MKNKTDKPDWFDGHVEVLGINDKWEKAFKAALKAKTIKMLGEVVCDACDGKGYLTDVYDTQAEEIQTQRCDSCKEFESDKQAREHIESEVA